MKFDDKLIEIKNKYVNLVTFVENMQDNIAENVDNIVEECGYMANEYREEIIRLEERVTYLEELLDDYGVYYE